MDPNPFLGVFFHWLGGLASGSFYVPFRFVRHWSWETYWLVGGFFSWIIAPWILALIINPDLGSILSEAPNSSLFWSYFFGAMWGFGGLTFGLTMRYLGMSLGMAVALGYCAAFGTLMPPIFRGEFVSQVLYTRSGLIILFGVAVCLTGIFIAGLAGVSKEREMTDEQKKAHIKEFNFWRGILVATFSGIMSASFAYGLAAGDPIKAIALSHGSPVLWQGLPVLVVVLLGGFTTNFVWCLILHKKNKTGREYITRTCVPVTSRAVSGSEDLVQAATSNGPVTPTLRVPMGRNYFFSALAGVTWYMQFFFYSMGETQMGQYRFSSWTIHMASIIIFSTLWGIALHEWKGSSPKTKALITAGLAVLILSTLIVGYGNYLGTQG
ncbi:MAG: L-rhamnose/proton symporter RhaT [Acidobacteria bacterium]|nr:MAG: L-rhamnose/proton symporter RhaT [Acidobacteriota bacterium]